MVEFLPRKELEEGEPVVWDIVPQMQVTLSRRQHIMSTRACGFRSTSATGRSAQVLTYFLWDWFDGGLFDGW